MRLFEGFYAYPWQGNDNNCNSYVFAGALKEGKHVIVDPGHLTTPYYREAGMERLLNGMNRDGLDGNDTGLVLLTHSHPDHSESAIVFRNEYHSLVAIHQADAPAFSYIGGKADIFLDEGSLEFSGSTGAALQIYHSPGHTPGHVTIYWPERRVLVAGDCIFYRSTGRADLPGGDARALGRTIQRLAELDIEYLLCGHPYGSSGIISGREEVRANFSYIRTLFY